MCFFYTCINWCYNVPVHQGAASHLANHNVRKDGIRELNHFHPHCKQTAASMQQTSKNLTRWAMISRALKRNFVPSALLEDHVWQCCAETLKEWRKLSDTMLAQPFSLPDGQVNVGRCARLLRSGYPWYPSLLMFAEMLRCIIPAVNVVFLSFLQSLQISVSVWLCTQRTLCLPIPLTISVSQPQEEQVNPQSRCLSFTETGCRLSNKFLVLSPASCQCLTKRF